MFDSGSVARKADEAKENKESVRRRAAEIDQLLHDELELDKASRDLGERLSGSAEAMGITAIHYKEFRQSGSRWMIEHTKDGDDYIYQMFPLRPIQADWRDTIILFIAAMDAVFPRSVEIRYVPPSEKYQITYFTIKVIRVTVQPGWEDACEKRALKALSGVPAWG